MHLVRLFNFQNLIRHELFNNPAVRQLRLKTCRLFTQDVSLLGSDGYSKEEQTYILGIINGHGGSELPSQIIGDGNSKKIKSFMNKVGHVDRLEDLLKVQGLGPRSVKKICDKLLEAKDGVSTSKNTELNSNKRYQATNSFVVPLLSDSHVSQLKILAAIQIGVNTLSWSVVDSHKKELLTWGVTDLITSSKNNLHPLLTTAHEIISKLPNADIFIFEDINWSNMAGAQLSVKVHMCRAQLTAMFMALLEKSGKHQGSENNPKVVFLKSRLTNQLFRRSVGSERVSTQRVVEDIIQQRVNAQHSNIFIGPMMKSVFFEHKGHYKESLCEPLLSTIAFMDLVIFKRTDMLQLAKSKKVKKPPENSTEKEA